MSPAGSPVVSETALGLFVAAGDDIVRTSPQTAGTMARGQLPANVDSIDAGAGAVWATVGGSDGDTARLVELDPDTLAAEASWPDVGAAMVLTGSTVWTAGSDLIGRSTASGAISRRVALPSGTISDAMSRDEAGTTVVVGTNDGKGDANEDVLAVNGTTGAVEGTRNFGGATSLGVAGPIDGTVWVAMAGGHAAVIQRLMAPALSPDPPCNDGLLAEPACTSGDSDIHVDSGGETLWISQQDGYSHCVTPVSDTFAANLPLSLASYVTYVGADHVFAMTGKTLQALSLPAACRGS